MTLEKRAFLMGFLAAYSATHDKPGDVVDGIQARAKMYGMAPLSQSEKIELFQFLIYANSIFDKNVGEVN